MLVELPRGLDMLDFVLWLKSRGYVLMPRPPGEEVFRVRFAVDDDKPLIRGPAALLPLRGPDGPSG